MDTIEVYQGELNKKFLSGIYQESKYVGETFGVDSLTDGKIYNVVYDKNNAIKIVDDSEDYIYDLNNLNHWMKVLGVGNSL